jgi:DNA-binding CsgD family transcriptional regulator
MAKRGRKPFNVADNVEEVERLAALGLTDSEICLSLGIHKATFYKYKRQKTEFTDAIKRGRAAGKIAVSNVLYDAAVNQKNMSAAMFIMKTRYGARETGPVLADDLADERDTSTIVYKEIDGRVHK